MNLIVIVLDSFRQDHVSTYHKGTSVFEGIAPCQTPNIDQFAEECVVFDNAYPEALPTIPIRTQLMTGQRTLPYRPWQPLTPEDVAIAQILSQEGYVSGLISDTYHYRAPRMNFHRDFHAYRWIRGQEYDPYVSAPLKRNLNDYINENFPQQWRNRITQFLANTDQFAGPEDWFAHTVVDEAVEWLEDNRPHEKIFLWIDSFDPHEPWDPPDPWDTYTDSDYSGPRIVMPMGGMASDWASDAEIKHIQGLYAGEAAFVDHCLGRLFDQLKHLGYYDNSLIFLLADHGHPLGDHGKFLKGADRMYNELLKIPFMVRLPKGEGARQTSAIIQFQDFLPTGLEALGFGNNISSMHGDSFLNVLNGDSDSHRDTIITGYHEGADRCIRDATWSYIQRPEGEPDELYNLIEDPRERNNLIDQQSDEAIRLASQFGNYFWRHGSATAIKGIQGKYELASGRVD